MKPEDRNALFEALISATGSEEVRNILSGIGDFDKATLNVPFGKHRLLWRPFGGKESNVSTTGLGTKPGRSLTERITNAMDAILEDRVVPGVAPANSPRRAANAWFGRPISTSDAGLFSWANKPADFDKHIHVVLQQSDQEESPTIDVLDDGIGIKGAEFPSTILSLQSGNKIRKRHLIGAFGQGGAVTLDFCDYTLIFSRAHAKPDTVAFTVIRVLKLDETYKEDCYGYLGTAIAGDDGNHVLEVPVSTQPIALYAEASKIPELAHGTLVRHVGYRLTNLANKLQASPGNLYHYLHYSVFDPLIPFRLVDLRAQEPRNEYIGGARNRLMARAKQSQQAGLDEEERIQIRHHRPMAYVVHCGCREAKVGVEEGSVLGHQERGGG